MIISFCFSYNKLVVLMNNASSLTFTTTAVLVSYILVEQLTTNQQDIIGGWFNIVGDILSASASWNSAIEEQLNDSQNNTNEQTNEQTNDDHLEVLKKSIEKIEELLNMKCQNE